MASSVTLPGVRVVRGPDWNCKRQDGGEGNLGTVVFVPKEGSVDKKVTVIWDSGRELRYIAGEKGKYELRVFDASPTGIKHEHVACDACNKKPIPGLRWKCSDCMNFNLCSPCYMADKHDTSHAFVRINVQQENGFSVPPRAASKTKLSAKGIFTDAEVIRGPHWKWKNQDGGQTGRVKELTSWGGHILGGGVKVKWDSTKEEHVYRLGAEGCIDILYSGGKEKGGFYYPDHLPVVDVVGKGQVVFQPSDKVIVTVSKDEFKELQNDEEYKDILDNKIDKRTIQKCIDEVGTIVGIFEDGFVINVQYRDGLLLHLHRSTLTRRHAFSKDEVVVIIKEEDFAKKLQEGHGGWNDDMRSALGKTGTIKKIDPDGDVRVVINGKSWIFNPVCIDRQDDLKMVELQRKNIEKKRKLQEFSSSSSSCSDEEEATQSVAEAVAQFFVNQLRSQPAIQTEGNLWKAAGDGDFQLVQNILQDFPNKINEIHEGKTALHLACFEGHLKVVDFLLKKGANASIVDDEGDTALHYAAMSNNPFVIKSILENGKLKDINMKNKKCQTPLFFAIAIGSVPCVQHLVQFGSDVNLKICEKDDMTTAMHDSIEQEKGQPDILKAVLGAEGADYAMVNSDNFNVLHWAILKDNLEAVKLILKQNKHLTSIPIHGEKDTVFPLHLAVINEQIEIIRVLLEYDADVDACDKAKRTSLHHSVLVGSKNALQLIIGKGCNVDAQDETGNTPLHLAVSVKKVPPSIRKLVMVTTIAQPSLTDIINLLLEAGAQSHIKNMDGKTALDLAPDGMLRLFMTNMNRRKNKVEVTKKEQLLPIHWDKLLPGEKFRKVLIHNRGMTEFEFKEISTLFHATMPQASLFSIHRVQNEYLWEVFTMKKRQLEQKYGLNGSNEMQLFHGTKPNVVSKICEENIDFRLAGERVGAIFGKGAYFALEAKYSDLYSPADENNHKFMFLVKVLVGKTCAGKKEYIRTPNVDPKNRDSDRYDCCVDNVKNPKIFCLFDQNQYYPLYIIEYA